MDGWKYDNEFMKKNDCKRQRKDAPEPLHSRSANQKGSLKMSTCSGAETLFIFFLFDRWKWLWSENYFFTNTSKAKLLNRCNLVTIFSVTNCQLNLHPFQQLLCKTWCEIVKCTEYVKINRNEWKWKKCYNMNNRNENLHL